MREGGGGASEGGRVVRGVPPPAEGDLHAAGPRWQHDAAGPPRATSLPPLFPVYVDTIYTYTCVCVCVLMGGGLGVCVCVCVLVSVTPDGRPGYSTQVHPHKNNSGSLMRQKYRREERKSHYFLCQIHTCSFESFNL